MAIAPNRAVFTLQSTLCKLTNILKPRTRVCQMRDKLKPFTGDKACGAVPSGHTYQFNPRRLERVDPLLMAKAVSNGLVHRLEFLNVYLSACHAVCGCYTKMFDTLVENDVQTPLTVPTG